MTLGGAVTGPRRSVTKRGGRLERIFLRFQKVGRTGRRQTQSVGLDRASALAAGRQFVARSGILGQLDRLSSARHDARDTGAARTVIAAAAAARGFAAAVIALHPSPKPLQEAGFAAVAFAAAVADIAAAAAADIRATAADIPTAAAAGRFTAAVVALEACPQLLQEADLAAAFISASAIGAATAAAGAVGACADCTCQRRGHHRPGRGCGGSGGRGGRRLGPGEPRRCY